MRFNVNLLSLVCAGALAFSSAPAPSRQTQPAPFAQAPAASARDAKAEGQPRFALLVGVGKYQSPSVPVLDGATNDVELMKETLTGFYGFEAKNVRTLTNEQATREEILKSFRTQLIEPARRAREQKQQAVVVFHFSGHGSRVADEPGGDETDGWDETLVPFDSRTERGYDIRDDETDDLFAELAEHTANVTFILDSCHSGTASRGDELLRARMTPDDARPQPPYKRKFPPTAEDESRAGKYVLISAALPFQRAFERPQAIAPRPNGALTFHLAEALRRASRQTSYRALMNEVAAAVKTEIIVQDPQVEGDADRLVFGGAAERAEPFIQIKRVEGGVVTFRAGKAHGVRTGTQVSIYAADATRYVGREKWLVNATVSEEPGPFESKAVLPAASVNPRVKEVTERSKVVLTAPTYGSEPLAVSLSDPSLTVGGEAAQKLRAEVRQRLEENLLVANELVRLVEEAGAGAPRAARTTPSGILRLRRGTFREAFPDPRLAAPSETCAGASASADAPLAAAAEGYHLDEGAGAPLFGLFVRADDPGAAEKLAAAIGNRARQQNLRHLANNASSLNALVGVTLRHTPGAVAYVCRDGQWRPRFEAQGPAVTPPRGELPVGSVYSFRIRNNSEERLYVAALLVSNDGRIRLIYPRVGENDPLGPGRETETLKLVTTRPAGRQVVKFVITKKYTDFSFYQTPSVKARDAGSPLERLLNQSGLKSRNDSLQDAPDQWGVISFDLVVTDAGPASAGPLALSGTFSP